MPTPRDTVRDMASITPAIARERMLMWANGILSHADEIRGRGDAPSAETLKLILEADTAEVQRWAAVYEALLAEPPELGGLRDPSGRLG